MRYTTPVVLSSAGPRYGAASVRPLDESLPPSEGDREADGRLGVPSNPDRNIGRNVDLRHIELKDGHVRFARCSAARRRKSRSPPAADAGKPPAPDRHSGRATAMISPGWSAERFLSASRPLGPYAHRPPLPKNDGWPVSTLAAENT